MSSVREQALQRLKADFAFKREAAGYLREGGPCPNCGKKELWIGKDHPWTLRCGRVEKCGWEGSVRTLYPDLFDNWSDRFPQSPADPHAAARAYLTDARGLSVKALDGAFSQEVYHDRGRNLTSATIRFALPPIGQLTGGWWERLIDRPQRFGKKKANFPYGFQYGGRVWHHPAETIATLADAPEIWIAEGVFDAAALGEMFARVRPKLRAVSALSTNNYPAAFLQAIAQAVAATGPDARRPRLVFAFDPGAAGTRYARKWVAQARAEGWDATAAQVTPDGEGATADWNDLLQAGKGSAEDLDAWLENGAITLAESPTEKAWLLFKRSQSSSFPFVFQTRQMWATVDMAAMAKRLEELASLPHFRAMSPDEQRDEAARDCIEVSELAECTWRALYFERDTALDQSSYYLRVDFPTAQPTIKANFPPASLVANSEFAKRLIAVAPGAFFVGSTPQLTRIMKSQTRGIRTVEALHFTGFSIDHGATILGDLAVHQGRVIEKNADDYFEVGKIGLKLRSPERTFTPVWDEANGHDKTFEWWPDFSIAFGARGLVCLSFWFLALFAEQIRKEQQSLGFLEMTGQPGTGKTTVLIFMWKLLGRRDGYEGFDPAKATAAAIARNLAKVANLPVVMIEGDRNQDAPHARRFDWDELKTLYNGHSTRSRGIATGGLETFEPRFRAALVVSQNRAIDADTAVLERIMAVHFDKTGWTAETKAAAERIERADPDQVSGWILAMLAQEANILALYRDRWRHHEQRLMGLEEVRNQRLAKNHAQLAAALDCLSKAMPVISRYELDSAQELITRMCVARHGAVDADHPVVVDFWETFDHIAAKERDSNPLDHSRRPGVIAVNLKEFEAACSRYKLRLPGDSMNELKRLLVTSKARKFLRQGTVNSVTAGSSSRSVHCWQFNDPDPDARRLIVGEAVAADAEDFEMGGFRD